jgi:pilus assembly protein CpaB
MKGKKIVVLYVLMLIVGLALLFTKTSPTPVAEPPAQLPVEVIKEEPKKEEPKTEIITVAVAKRDINKKSILSKDDYYFKTIEISINSEQKPEYITDAVEVDTYITKNNIAKDSFIKRSFIVSPKSPDYAILALKEGNYMFPFKLEKTDTYLAKNLKSGDLVDIYIFYGDDGFTDYHDKSRKEANLVSPSNAFNKNRIKPIIVGKRILYIDLDDDMKNFGKVETAQIQLELSNQEIKLLRTLMTNSTIMMYPSTYKKNVDDGLRLLSDKEKNWPLSDKDIFSKKKRLNLLKGN